MTPEPFFTIILPTYNRAVMLKSAIQSVLRQICQDYECFVLDDGSTDQTPAVCEEFKNEKLFSFIHFDDNKRQHVRRNYALGRARGRFISFLDSDDIWLPQRLEVFKRAIESRPKTEFWFSNAYLLRDNKIMGTLFDPRRPLVEGVVPGWYAVGDEHIPYLTTNLAVGREIFNRVGVFREDMKILEDTELYARMLASGVQVGAIREPLAIRCLHLNQITMDHVTNYKEYLMALEAGKIAPQQKEIERVKLARKTVKYLLKNLRPIEARQFILVELGNNAKKTRLYFLTFIPKWILIFAKQMRKLYLMIRYHPLFADSKIAETYKFLNPLLEEEDRRDSSVR